VSAAKRAPAREPPERPALADRWPANEIVFLPIKSLVPHARNARVHSDEQVQQIAASMREFGWVNPVLVDKDRILIAGHGRVLVADGILQWKEVPAMIARGWSDAKKRAYMLADNKIALNATWDPEMLFAELQALTNPSARTCWASARTI
jgi:ParB-like chromosome segregation protein Spo0J